MSDGRRKYKFNVTYIDKPLGKGYGGTVILEAYNRDEAVSQFKERRWELPVWPDTSTMRPMGRDCDFTVDPVELSIVVS